jgi:hypothetical protein
MTTQMSVGNPAGLAIDETRGPASRTPARRRVTDTETARPVLPLRDARCRICHRQLDPRLAPLGEHLPSERAGLCKP